LPANPTAPVIADLNRRHAEAQLLFQTYQNVDQALRNQVIAAVPEVYIVALRDDITGFGTVTTRQLLAHLWSSYGTITQTELDTNDLRMQTPWNPPTPIEALFSQLREGVTYAQAGGEALSNAHVMRIGYNLIQKTGLFELACRDWRLMTAPPTLPLFQDHFRKADQDRHANGTTTASHGFHARANHVEVAPPTSNATTALIAAASTSTIMSLRHYQ
jgi:hypothetical protein